MTSFNRTFKALWLPKFRIANWMLALYGLLVIVNAITNGLSNGFSQVNPADVTLDSGVGLGVVTFVWLAFRTEHDLTRGSYRLLPISDTQFYLTGLLTTLCAYLYFTAVRALVMGLGFVWGNHAALSRLWNQAWQEIKQGAVHENLPAILAFVAGMILLLLIWSWVMVSLIHLLTNALSAFLPHARQKLVRFVLAVVVIGILIYMGWWLMSLGSFLTGGVSNNAAMAISLVVLAAITAVMAAVNIYLLKYWTEAPV